MTLFYGGIIRKRIGRVNISHRKTELLQRILTFDSSPDRGKYRFIWQSSQRESSISVNRRAANRSMEDAALAYTSNSLSRVLIHCLYCNNLLSFCFRLRLNQQLKGCEIYFIPLIVSALKNVFTVNLPTEDTTSYSIRLSNLLVK